MAIKKYEFTGETREWDGITLHRIRALVDIAAIGVSVGQLGGWIEREENLSHIGRAWVGNEAIVCRGGAIHGGTIHGGAIHGGTIWGGTIWGGTIWGGTIWGGTIEGGTIEGGTIRGGTIRGGTIWDGAIWDGALVKSNADHGAFCTVGSEGGTLTWYFNEAREIQVNRGCFSGTLDEFAAAVEKTHGDNSHGQQYRILIEFIKLRAAQALEA